ncbi:MAG: hypothetical protein O3B42_10180 [Actinomycetota bacterium]|nr:hypothetical protein [Actinomycetota bacterium]
MRLDAATLPFQVSDVAVAVIRAPLPSPIKFGSWEMFHRDFALVRVTLAGGSVGYSFTLTRDGPVAEAVRLAGRSYVGTEFESPEAAFHVAKSANPATMSTGVGLRGVSLIDLAVWDAVCKDADMSVVDALGGASQKIPVTAIVGYPPTMDLDGVFEQVGALWAAGWRRFKMAVAGSWQQTYDRLGAANAAAPLGRIGLDGAWTFRTVSEAVEFCEGLPIELEWFEDIFPPGDAAQLANLRASVSTPIAVGDEQGGSYYPEALVAAAAVDVVRLDATCMGGASTFLRMASDLTSQGVTISPHMNAHVHSRLLNALSIDDVAVEWGVPGTGVDQFADSLEQPSVVDGYMKPLSPDAGFGSLTNAEWLDGKQIDDHGGVVADLLGNTS